MNFVLLAAGNWFLEIWHWLWLMICQGIYIFIGFLYRVFEKIASVNLFNDEIFATITGRLYLVMGVAMLFVLAYNIILAIINPDGKDKGTTGLAKSVKETIISLVIIVLLPTLFNYMYIFQTNVLESNIIGTIILGGAGSTGDDLDCASDDYECLCDFSEFEEVEKYNNDAFWPWDSRTSNKKSILTAACLNYKALPASVRGAYSISPTIFSAFYRPANFTFNDCANYLRGYSTSVTFDDTDKKVCVNFFTDVLLSKYTGDIGPFARDSYLKDVVSDSSKSNMEFHYLMAVVAGVLALYMFFCYSMEIGVRVAKLGFLQLISPIPVMMRIIPGQKEKIYDKWFNHLKNTYLDVFIRLAIIFFVLFGISLVPDVLDTMWSSIWAGETGVSAFFVKALVSVFVILGLLRFGQQAPELFKEFFSGAGGSFALRGPVKQLKENKYAGAAMGAVGAGASSAAGNFWNTIKKVKDSKSFGEGAKNAVSGIGKTVGGTVGGAVRGAKRGYGAENYRDLGRRIAKAKYETDSARPIKEKFKYAKRKVEEGVTDFGQFISGTGASNLKLNAAETILGSTQNINANFKNGKIEGIEEAFNKMNAKYLNGEDLNFKGKDYRKSGNEWINKVDSTDKISNGAMGENIKAYFDNLKKAEYVAQYMAMENTRAFERLTSKMVSDLRKELPIIGRDMIDVLNNKLSKAEIDCKFNNIGDITDKIEELLNVPSTAKNYEDSRRQLYDIFEAMEKTSKASKKTELIAQEAKKSDKK